MPELAEVETIKRIMLPIVKGKTITEVHVFRDKTVLSDVGEFKSILPGKTFVDLTRIGKFLVFHLSDGHIIISHLRMEGKYFEDRVIDPFRKQDLVAYDFSDGSRLTYNDVRKFGIIKLSDEAHYKIEPPISEVGPEPWQIKPEDLFEELKKKKSKPIKEALLDQTMIAGLGNIYVDETLFATKINPKTLAKNITMNQAVSIKREASRILDLAIASGGSTIRSYHPKEGMDGSMQNNLLAYGHEGEKCPVCGFPFRKIEIGGRGTTYCPRCQPLQGHPFVLGVTGPIASGKSTVSNYFVSKGYEKIDADEIVGELYENVQVQSTLRDLFGERTVANGRIDKAYLASLIAADAKKRVLLDEYVHPLVKNEIERRLRDSTSTKTVLDVPLLFESGLDQICDFIITVVSDEKQKSARIVLRGKDPKVALQMNAGWPLRQARAKSSVIIENNGTVNELLDKLHKLDKIL